MGTPSTPMAKKFGGGRCGAKEKRINAEMSMMTSLRCAFVFVGLRRDQSARQVRMIGSRQVGGALPDVGLARDAATIRFKTR